MITNIFIVLCLVSKCLVSLQSMYYVYILLLDDIPIYAGITNNPVLRFRRHYMANDCGTYYILRYYLFERNKLVKMKLVYCNDDRNKSFSMEGAAIYALHKAGFNIINSPYKGIFPKVNDKRRMPHKIFTKESLQYINDNINEIKKEYGY